MGEGSHQPHIRLQAGPADTYCSCCCLLPAYAAAAVRVEARAASKLLHGGISISSSSSTRIDRLGYEALNSIWRNAQATPADFCVHLLQQHIDTDMPAATIVMRWKQMVVVQSLRLLHMLCSKCCCCTSSPELASTGQHACW